VFRAAGVLPRKQGTAEVDTGTRIQQFKLNRTPYDKRIAARCEKDYRESGWSGRSSLWGGSEKNATRGKKHLEDFP
jgi:hypothetical protein